MIVWFNCKISDNRLNPIGDRYNLRTDSRFDVARYTFASLVPLEPVISKIIFNLELDGELSERKQEMEEWINSLFPLEKIKIFWHRCNNLAQWREIQPEIDAVDDDLIYLAGNDDHVFIDSTTAIYEKGLELLKQDPDPRAALANCHYPELLREARNRGATLTPCGNFLNYNFEASYAFVVIKKELYHSFLDKLDPDRYVYRMDGWEYTEVYSKWYTPTKELCRHYDGYNHVGMDPNACPPMDIPLGFFDKNIKIRYGFNDRDPNCVNINPLSANLYTVDKNGADYKFALEDIPAFWKPYIKEIEIADNLDKFQLTIARNRHYLNLANASFWGGQTNVPLEWVKPHMLKAV